MVELIEILESQYIPFSMCVNFTYTRNDVTHTIGVDHLYFDEPRDAMKAWAIATDMGLKCQLAPLAQDEYALMVFKSYSG